MHEWKTFDYRETTDNDRITWIFQDFVPVAKLQGDKSYSIISDHIGTPLVAIDNEGVKVWERELDIYGKVRKLQGDKWFIPFLYAGQYYDVETDLAYNRFRYYDPNSGNYISQDPIGLAGGNPTLYGYVFDSNVEIDIFGLDCTSSKYTKSNLKLGKEKHLEYKKDIADQVNFIKEFRLPSGKRIDFLDIPNQTIYELKPYNPRAIKAGQKQLQIYLDEIKSIPKFSDIEWKIILDVY